jgi:hypothetical protein
MQADRAWPAVPQPPKPVSPRGSQTGAKGRCGGKMERRLTLALGRTLRPIGRLGRGGSAGWGGWGKLGLWWSGHG